ncbi:unnamed protein product [Urochloa humidicola]
MAKGDPSTRPDAETVFVPNSFALEHDVRDWESTTLVPWAMHLPRDAGARDIEAMLLQALHLQKGALTVTLHQPEPYLIRFERGEDCAAAMAHRRGRFHGRNGLDICLRPWKSLSTAMGMRLFFRVRLCLDGIPGHTWTPEIVERVIGNKCALQCINTDLVQPVDTRHIDLWAWTPNPSDIPKRVWLVFTHRPTDKSSVEVHTAEPATDRWQQGLKFEVFIHMPVLEDYTAATVNLQAAVENNFQPVRRTYEWRYGLEDGAPPGARARFPARIPKPPKEMPDQGPRGKEEGRTRGDIRHGVRREGCRVGRGSAGSCNDKAFDWPCRHDDDDSDNYEHPGRGVDGYAKYRGRHEPRRVRSRSPRRRDTSFHGGRRHGTDELVRQERTRSPRRRDVEFSTAPLQNESTPQIKKIFTEQVLPPQCNNQRDCYDKVRELTSTVASLQSGMAMFQQHLQLHMTQLQEQQLQWMRKAEEYLLKTGSFTNRLGVNTDTMGRTRGNGAWSATIPARHVFGRLREEMTTGFGLGRPATTAPRHLNFEAQEEGTGGDYNDGNAQPMDVDDLHGDGGRPARRRNGGKSAGSAAAAGR